MRTLATTLTLLALALVGAAPAWSQNTQTVDNFEWAAGMAPSSYPTAISQKGWKPRATGFPSLTISTQAKQGGYSLQIDQARNQDDYTIISFEDLFPTTKATNWSQYKYISFWAKASKPLTEASKAFEIRTRDWAQDWGYLYPQAVGTDWTYIVYKLPAASYLDSLRYVRFYTRGNNAAQALLPYTVWIDDVQIHKSDPRGVSQMLEDFEWGVNVTSTDKNVRIDSLFERKWRTRVRSKNATTGVWTINPDYDIVAGGRGGNGFALKATPNRDNEDYFIMDLETRDANGQTVYADWTPYRYLSFYVKGDSAWDSPAKIQVVNSQSAQKFCAGENSTFPNLSSDWKLVVIDLWSSASCQPQSPALFAQVRYPRWDIYSMTSKGNPPPGYNFYLDDVMLSAFDPSKPATPTGLAEEAALARDGAVLTQNHPNPFSGRTTIRYALAQPGAVTLEVFDLVGRRVATLLDDTVQPAGEQAVRWDAAAGLPSGLYVYRLTVDGRVVANRTMVLVK